MGEQFGSICSDKCITLCLPRQPILHHTMPDRRIFCHILCHLCVPHRVERLMWPILSLGCTGFVHCIMEIEWAFCMCCVASCSLLCICYLYICTMPCSPPDVLLPNVHARNSVPVALHHVVVLYYGNRRILRFILDVTVNTHGSSLSKMPLLISSS